MEELRTSFLSHRLNDKTKIEPNAFMNELRLYECELLISWTLHIVWYNHYVHVTIVRSETAMLSQNFFTS